MNQFLYLACAGGRLFRFHIESGESTLIYQHPTAQAMMGLAFSKGQLYFGGQTFLGKGKVCNGRVRVLKLTEFFSVPWEKAYQVMRRFWMKRVGSASRAMPYVNPQFHQMNMYHDKLYVTVTGRNEIWELSQDLELLRCIIVQPHIEDYNHLNNVFYDGQYYYVCLARYEKELGPGGFAKFDKDWVEVERQSLGWESHGFCILGGKRFHLFSSSGAIKGPLFHPHRAGLMVDETIVFEYDPDKYFCKDFSMDENHIYLVGGEVKPRDERKESNGIVFVLNHDFEFLKKSTILNGGGIGGCHLSDVDDTDGGDRF